MILCPGDPLEANWQFQELSRGGIKGSIEKEEGIADRNVLVRITLVAGFNPKNGGRSIAPPLLVTWARFHSIMNIGNSVLKRFVGQLPNSAGLEIRHRNP